MHTDSSNNKIKYFKKKVYFVDLDRISYIGQKGRFDEGILWGISEKTQHGKIM
jgi:hypothetical protein